MSFVNFLLEYYIYILVVLIILVIGVIGFLADARSKNKSKKNVNKQEAKVGSDSQLNANLAGAVDSQQMNNQEVIQNVDLSTNEQVNVENVNQTQAVEQPQMNVVPEMVNQVPVIEQPQVNVSQTMGNDNSNSQQMSGNMISGGITTTDGAQPFDISSMFANNK